LFEGTKLCKRTEICDIKLCKQSENLSIGSSHHPFVLATAFCTGHFSAHLKSVTLPACTCSEIIFYMLKDAFYICVKLPLQFQKNAVQAA
jgi:hypothetical protein